MIKFLDFIFKIRINSQNSIDKLLEIISMQMLLRKNFELSKAIGRINLHIVGANLSDFRLGVFVYILLISVFINLFGHFKIKL